MIKQIVVACGDIPALIHLSQFARSGLPLRNAGSVCFPGVLHDKLLNNYYELNFGALESEPQLLAAPLINEKELLLITCSPAYLLPKVKIKSLFSFLQQHFVNVPIEVLFVIPNYIDNINDHCVRIACQGNLIYPNIIQNLIYNHFNYHLFFVHTLNSFGINSITVKQHNVFLHNNDFFSKKNDLDIIDSQISASVPFRTRLDYAYIMSAITNLAIRNSPAEKHQLWKNENGLFMDEVEDRSILSHKEQQILLNLVKEPHKWINRKFGIKVPDEFKPLAEFDPECIDGNCVHGFMERLTPELNAFVTNLLHGFYISDLPQPEQKWFANFLVKQKVYTIKSTPPKVSVLTTTYNHENFIRENIESVASQITSFPFEHIIVDDGSNDGTTEIIQDYASQYSHIKPILLGKNYGGPLGHRLMFSKAAAPYVALCDGDDLFCDRHKLQSQADFLDENPSCGLCFHPVAVIFPNAEFDNHIFPPQQMLPRGVSKFYYLTDLLKWNMMQTNSVMYRWRFHSEALPSWFRTDLLPADWYWNLLHAELGKIGYIDKIMSIYRRHSSSMYYQVYNSRILHRVKTGIRELRMLEEVNTHFKGRYARICMNLANSVFYDIAQYEQETNDSALLDRIIIEFPDFATHFYNTVKHAAQTDC